MGAGRTNCANRPKLFSPRELGCFAFTAGFIQYRFHFSSVVREIEHNLNRNFVTSLIVEVVNVLLHLEAIINNSLSALSEGLLHEGSWSNIYIGPKCELRATHIAAHGVFRSVLPAFCIDTFFLAKAISQGASALLKLTKAIKEAGAKAILIAPKVGGAKLSDGKMMKADGQLIGSPSRWCADMKTNAFRSLM